MSIIRLLSASLPFALVAAVVPPASAAALDHESQIVITEIMYDPASKEDKGQSEWVEIANLGKQPVEMKNWRLDDEDRDDWAPFSCTIEPGGVVVLINGDHVTESEFRTAWDGVTSEVATEGSASKPLYQVIGVKWGSLANSPDNENEILRLLDEHDDIVCEVNFQKAGDWPANKPSGASIWLSDLTATNLNLGELWKRSEAGKSGARMVTMSPVFNGADVGSPGYVHGLSPLVPDVDIEPPSKNNPAEPQPVDPAPAPEPDPTPEDTDN